MLVKVGETVISFCWGDRSLREMFYVDDFDSLDNEYDNFEWYVALSDQQPEDCKPSVCGPLMMYASVVNKLNELGVEDEDILLDDVGAKRSVIGSC
jgi:Na+-transporting NADH:ubiquinone oxidoreductase subunit F